MADTNNTSDVSVDFGKVNSTMTYTYDMDNLKKDIAINDYNFDKNNTLCSKDQGIEIDGFLFFPEEIKGDASYSSRKYNRTKIMNGGEFVSRGQYEPREFSFTTYLELNPEEPYLYDKVFQIMENKECEVISPYLGDKFTAEVEFTKTHPKASPRTLKLDIKIKETVNPRDQLPGDPKFDYPETTNYQRYKWVYVAGNPKVEDEEDTRGKFLRSDGSAVSSENAHYFGDGKGKYEWKGE